MDWVLNGLCISVLGLLGRIYPHGNVSRETFYSHVEWEGITCGIWVLLCMD